MNVYLLWHVHHVMQDENGVVSHFEDGGSFSAFEEEGDDVKLLGVYSTRDAAESRVRRAVELPGFRGEPNCFWVDEYQVDRDEWSEGYVSV